MCSFPGWSWVYGVSRTRENFLVLCFYEYLEETKASCFDEILKQCLFLKATLFAVIHEKKGYNTLYSCILPNAEI